MTEVTSDINGFVIEKGVPLARPRKRQAKYPLNQMEAGDSFSLKSADRKSAACVRTLIYVEFGVARLATKKFAIRKDESGNYRCWRIT